MKKNRKLFLSSKKIEKWPTKSQWRQFFKILTKKEKIALFSLCLLALISFLFLSLNFYFKHTELKRAKGGNYTEGVVDRPRFINPIYANSDVDRDLVELLFSGLMKYNKNLEIVPDLAQSYEATNQGKIYKFYLKENIFWQDETPITVDDVIFTIKKIQDPDYKSPFRASWLGVEIKKISDREIEFKLKNSSSKFLEITTQKIIPKHIWQDIPAQNFPLAIHNLKPVGSGPYKLKKIEKDKLGYIKSLSLVRNPNYFDQKPNISKLNFSFFDNEKQLIKAVNLGQIEGLSPISQINSKRGWKAYHLALPRYFALFFNQKKSEILAEKDIRLALNYATNKEEIVEKIFSQKNSGKVVQSPILPEFYGFDSPSKIYEFNTEKAKELLDKAGFQEPDQGGFRKKILKKKPAFQFTEYLKLGSRGKEVEKLQQCLTKDSQVYPEGEITGYFGKKTEEAVIKFQEKYAKDILEPWGFKKGTGLVSKTTRAKLNEICFSLPIEFIPLKFSLVTVEQPQLIEVANILKNQWQTLGIELEIKTVEISKLEQEFIKPRNYEILLFGEALGAVPDPYPFWHSSQKNNPGLNLALYENKIADDLLEEARQALNESDRKEKYQRFQDILLADAPAIFLYSPDYIYFVSPKIKGIEVKKITDPSKRFVGIEDWYIKTKRVWK